MKLRSALIAALLVACCSVLPTAKIVVAAGNRPNILFIITDDQAQETLSCYGDKYCDTPNLDRLAAEGMVIDDAHHMGSWSGAVCTCSRTMIMTGKSLWRIPDKNKTGPKGTPEARKQAAEQSMPAIFNKAGYATFRTCKTGNSFDEANRLFQVSKVAMRREGTEENGSAWHAEQVLDYLNDRESQKAEKPFLIYFGFSHPHDPRNAIPELAAKYGASNEGPGDKPASKAPPLPDNYLPGHPFHHGHPGLRDEEKVQGVLTRRDEATVRNERGREFACIEYIDQQIGRVLERLEKMGELDNTYIFFTSDHGMSVGRHGLMGKQNLYEHTWKVPFLAKGPGIRAGSRAAGNIYLLDVLPTICDLAGIDVPETVEGKSFRAVLEGKQDTVRDVMYGIYCGGTKPGMRSIKKDGWKLIEYDVLDGQVRETQLFNLQDNPREFLIEHHDPELEKLLGIAPGPRQIDLAEDPHFADKRAELEELLAKAMKEFDDPYELSPNPAPTKVTFDRDKAVLEENLIPHGPLPKKHQTHASTITEAADGTLLASWFGGTREGNPDVKIWLSRKPVGQPWSEPEMIDSGNRMVDGKETEFACWNPVLFTHPDGTIYFWYKVTGSGDRPGPQNWWGAVRTSTDNGKTWSERTWLPKIDPTGDYKVFKPYDGILAGPVKNRPVILPDGRLLCGSSTETTHGWRVHFEIYPADDWTGQKGKVEVTKPLMGGKEGIQPSFLVHAKDMSVLQVLSREDGQAWSHDGGHTWTDVVAGPVDTSVGLHAVTTTDGWHFLTFNPVKRTPLSLARSRDGKNWETILPELSYNEGKEVDYPTIMQARDGKLHVVHSWGREQITHLVLDTEYLQRTASADGN